jgi:hypothetical protein
MQIELTRDEYECLLILMGYATAAALHHGDPKLVRSFQRVANAVSRNNPDWKPLQIESEPDGE